MPPFKLSSDAPKIIRGEEQPKKKRKTTVQSMHHVKRCVEMSDVFMTLVLMVYTFSVTLHITQ